MSPASKFKGRWMVALTASMMMAPTKAPTAVRKGSVECRTRALKPIPMMARLQM